MDKAKSGQNSNSDNKAGSTKPSFKTTRKIWRLRKGADRRFSSGHPWVYSNELMESPKGIEPGEMIELHDAGGKFLARGYGNPNSLIAFRSLTRSQSITHPESSAEIFVTLKKALEVRLIAGLGRGSFRLCFGEADGLPGLIIDFYRMISGQTWVIQAHSAGADRMLPEVIDALQLLVTEPALNAGSWEQTSIVLRNDLNVRKLEGIPVENPKVLKQAVSHVLTPASIWIQAVLSTELIPFEVDLVEGQKTGFFLDQYTNIELAALRLKGLVERGSDRERTLRPLRILDLCCYVGQWGTQLSKVFAKFGRAVEVVAVDASPSALDYARKNIQSQGAQVESRKADVLKDLSPWESQSFDLVIADPPAFIKSRKDLAVGARAYAQLTQQAFRLVRPGGGVVCCSCSGLFEEELFAATLAKSAQRSGRSVRWVGRGTQSPDHPMLPEFPEGRYLKCWIGIVN